MNKTLLRIKNLNAYIETKQILKNFELEINPNEIHVIMGPNGCGKSTLSKIIAGHPIYNVTDGTIEFENENLLEMEPENRSHKGLFLAFQYPLEINGVSNYDFLRLAYNEKRKYLKLAEVTPLEFMTLVQNKSELLKISSDFFNRDLNHGFSGGEKKKNEILQMLLLEPKLVILDELDSGLDMDAIKIICQTIIKYRPKNSSIIIITHYPTILKYFEPTSIHIMMNGKIIKTGGIDLIESIEAKGYESF